jgi:AraC-like DNA-binding protein
VIRTDLTEIAAAVEKLAVKEGAQPCAVEGVTLVRHNQTLMKLPVLFGPSVVFVVQGQKYAHLGDESYMYDPQRYLVLTSVLPFVWSAITQGKRPNLSVFLQLRRDTVLELLGTMQLDLGRDSQENLMLFAGHEVTAAIRHSLWRLLLAARVPEDARVLGPGILRELLYRVLQGPGGPSVRASLGFDGHFAQIARAIRNLHDNFTKPVSISELAASVGMSVSVFHRYFKQFTKQSPLQYIKALRLHRARTLMLREGIKVAPAAERVGYESSTQFSREYKRFFGHSPSSPAAQQQTEHPPPRWPRRIGSGRTNKP